MSTIALLQSLAPVASAIAAPRNDPSIHLTLLRDAQFRYFGHVAGIEIHLLGGFDIRAHGEPVDAIPSRAARSLLAFLAMNQGRTHMRDFVAGTFWPELPDSEARRRLSKALWQIRSILDPAAGSSYRSIRSSGGGLRLDPDAGICVDVDQFRQLLRRAASSSVSEYLTEIEDLENAVALYRGDLLEGFYEDWLVADREALRQQFHAALGRLSDLYMSKGDYETALARARTLALRQPLAEDGHQRVMRLAALLGRHNEALLQYDLCRQVLRSELGAEPAETTRALFEAIVRRRELAEDGLGSSHQYTRSGAPTPAPFVGRRSERSKLVQHLDALLAGVGGVVLLEGAAGVGKTRLLQEVAADAQWRGVDVLWGRSVHTGSRPYAPLTEALAAGLTPLRVREVAAGLDSVWIQQLVRLVPSLGQAGEPGALPEAVLRPSEEQARMKEAITRAFGALARISPLLLVIEDVHWADGDTIGALAQLTAQIEGHRLLVIVAFRPAEAQGSDRVWRLIRSLDQEPQCTRVQLQGCSPAETEELVRRCLGLPSIDVDLARQVHRATGGVPLLIIEMLRGYEEQRSLKQPAPSGQIPHAATTPELGPQLDSLLRKRLLDLPDEARFLLELLSVHDGELTLSEVRSASDFDRADVERGMEILTRRRLVVGTPERYALAHELLRTAVHGELPPSCLQRLHWRVGMAVEAHRPDEVELLAHHFLTAEQPDRASPYLERAAERAIQAAAYESAAHYLALAAEALDAAHATRQDKFRVASRQEHVLDVLGRRAEQEQALRRMELNASTSEKTDVSRRRAWWLANQDQLTEADAEAHQSLELAHRAADKGRVLSALSTLGMIACIAGRAADGLRHLQTAIACGGTDLHQQADARNALGQNLLDLQRFDEAEPQLLAALALYTELGDLRGQAEVFGMLGTLRMERGEPALAETALSRALEIGASIGYRHGEAMCRMNLGILHVFQSKLDSALKQFSEAERVCARAGNSRDRALVLSNAAWLRHAVLGQDKLAEHDAQAAIQTYRSLGDLRGQAQCLGILASIVSRKGDASQGRRLFGQSLALARDVRDSWIEVQVLTEWTRCNLEGGEVEEGMIHARDALQLSRTIGTSHLTVRLNALLGRLLLELGRAREGLAATSAAVKALPDQPLGPSVAFAHALVLAALGQPEESDRYLERAYQSVASALADLPQEDREAALAGVPAHREIVAGWSARQPLRQTCRMARINAPIGRPLATNDLVGVLWTVHSPDDLTISEIPERRRHRLIRLVSEAASQGASPTVREIADALGASVATIRRDLKLLRTQGVFIATRGNEGRGRQAKTHGQRLEDRPDRDPNPAS